MEDQKDEIVEAGIGIGALSLSAIMLDAISQKSKAWLLAGTLVRIVDKGDEIIFDFIDGADRACEISIRFAPQTIEAPVGSIN